VAKLSMHHLWPRCALLLDCRPTRLLSCDRHWLDFCGKAFAIGEAVATQTWYLIPLLVLLLSVGSKAVAEQSGITIRVRPTTDCIISGQQGGSFAPIECKYVITSNHKWANVKVSGIPPWLIASTTFGRTPLTVKLALDQTYVAQQLDGNYSATITFTNVTSRAGTVAHEALLTVTELSVSTPAANTSPSPVTVTGPSPAPSAPGLSPSQIPSPVTVTGPSPAPSLPGLSPSQSPGPVTVTGPSPAPSAPGLSPSLIPSPSPTPASSATTSGILLDGFGFVLLDINGGRLLAQ